MTMSRATQAGADIHRWVIVFRRASPIWVDAERMERRGGAIVFTSHGVDVLTVWPEAVEHIEEHRSTT